MKRNKQCKLLHGVVFLILGLIFRTLIAQSIVDSLEEVQSRIFKILVITSLGVAGLKSGNSILQTLGNLLHLVVVLFVGAHGQGIGLVHEGGLLLEPQGTFAIVTPHIVRIDFRSLAVGLEGAVEVLDSGQDVAFHIVEGRVVWHLGLGLVQKIDDYHRILFHLDVQIDEVRQDAGVVRIVLETVGQVLLRGGGILLREGAIGQGGVDITFSGVPLVEALVIKLLGSVEVAGVGGREGGIVDTI